MTVTPIRIGLVGCGIVAAIHAEAYLTSGQRFAVLAACDTHRDAAQAAADRFPRCAVYTDYRDVLARADIDAVDIMLPHYLNEQIALEALESGKHVLVEKPVARTLPAADALIERAAATGRVLMVAENERYDPVNLKIRELLDQGTIGRILSARADHQLFENRSPDHWLHSNLKAGGGGLISGGIHRVHVLRWLVGEVVRVSCFQATRLVPMEGEDVSLSLLEFSNGALGQLAVVWHNKAALADYRDPWYESLHLYGDAGVIHTVGGLHVYSERKPGFDSGFRRIRFGKSEAELSQDSFAREIAHFGDCVLNGMTPLTSATECRRSLEIVLACYEAARERRVVTIGSSTPE